MTSLMICTPHQNYSGDKMTEMRGARGANVGQERSIQNFGGETLGKETTWRILK